MSLRPDIAENLTLAEAAAWLVRLQGSDRSAATEAAFRAWLAEDPAHAHAFARVTDTWEIVPGAARMAAPARTPRRGRLLAVAASLSLVAILAGYAWLAMRDPIYQTRVGEQRTVTLEDGSRVTLNTGTRLAVDYDADQRRIRLERGEALFEVAKNPRRPFTVQAGHEQVRALGTTFSVRRDRDRVDVLLIEGRVQVSRQAAKADARASPSIVLAPGDRLALREGRAATTRDRPVVDEVTAWRRGEAMFDNVTLAEAIAEINRYGRVQVRVSDPELAALRISGVFATRDPAEFAEVVARLHGLDTVRTPQGVALTVKPDGRRR